MVRKEIILEHHTRKKIYDHIVTYPGVHFTILKEKFDLTDGTLRYHLKYLEKAEKIRQGSNGGRRKYYPLQTNGFVTGLEKDGIETENLTTKQKRIIALIKSRPGIKQKELLELVDMNRFTVSYNIRKFLEMGVIRKMQNGRSVCYEYITDGQLKMEMLRALTVKLLNSEIDEKTFHKLRVQLG